MGLLRALNKIRGGYPGGWKRYARGYQGDRPPPFVPPNDPDDAPPEHPSGTRQRTPLAWAVHAFCALGGSPCRSAGYGEKTGERAYEAESMWASQRPTPTPR